MGRPLSDRAIFVAFWSVTAPALAVFWSFVIAAVVRAI